MSTLVLLRHGQSLWNQEKRFTGWIDVDLNKRGADEARSAGRMMTKAGLEPDTVHTSVLTRAIRTANLALEEMAFSWLPVRRHWRLNERHYGALQGLTHEEMAAVHGPEQVMTWRRSYAIRPPALEVSDERHPRFDRRYRNLDPDVLPSTECLADVVERMLPYWYDAITPDLASGQRVLVVAHGNSLRALVKHLERIPDEDIPALEIPTGIPRIYELDSSFEPVSATYLD